MAVEGLNILTKHARQVNLFKGLEIEVDKITISYLQYADDTIFFGEWSKKNAGNLINLLKCFEIYSGLKVNFTKSCLYGVGVNANANAIESMASYMRCRVGNFPFTCIGVPISQKMNKLEIGKMS
ncbi:uncharacterized protein [Rutidosis leptorrhynchoides]|uniref:uncharacterized protein n=1 Tax=Rutidosis leptorrhynchoides TaxID=125765 RepID=UPI003A9A28AC